MKRESNDFRGGDRFLSAKQETQLFMNPSCNIFEITKVCDAEHFYKSNRTFTPTKC